MQGKTGGNTEEDDQNSQFIELYTLLKIKGQAENNEICATGRPGLKVKYNTGLWLRTMTCTLANL